MLEIGKSGKRCAMCGNTTLATLDKHHVVPAAAGGKRTQWNILYLCASCHRLVHRWKHLEKRLKESGDLTQVVSLITKKGKCDVCGKWDSEGYCVGSEKGPKGLASKVVYICRHCHEFVSDWMALEVARRKRAELATRLASVRDLCYEKDDDVWCCRCLDTPDREYYEIEVTYCHHNTDWGVGKYWEVATVNLCRQCIEKLELWAHERTPGSRAST